jgi:succinate-semialdehyde dehydrogenase/glutarate-semialdehyde dehydrogenase
MIQSLNPATGKILRSFDALTPEALNSRLAIAAGAARTYPRESLDQRIFWMRRLAALLESDLEELAALITAEMGKTLASARAEVEKCAAGCRYYAENAERILTPEHIDSDHADSYLRYDPIGVVLAVMPWNFPLWQVFRFAAPALMAGNVALLKHAGNVPQCALAIEALIRRAGFPRGVFQTLLVEARQVETILADERIAAVTVTGSEAAGRSVAAQAGWLIKKSVLELGGSDPFIVLPSADLDAAVASAVEARTINNGQSCIAAKRFLVHEDIYDEFERRFVEGMAALRVGDPMLDTTDVGPIATVKIAEELAQQVAAAQTAGGRVLTGGNRKTVGGQGNYFEPTVIAGVQRSAPIAREEIFGPVALLFRIGSLEEAVALANDTSFGLAASAWTRDPMEQERLAAELECGAVFFNEIVTSDPRLPFGGTKKSGYGRELGAAGMREFLNVKTVVIGGARVAKPVLVEQKKTEPLTRDKPGEFSQLADQIRKFEPRKPNADLEPAGQRRIPGGLPPLVFEATPEPRRFAPIVWDSPPEQRRPAPIVREPEPQQPSAAATTEPRKVPGGLKPLVFDSAPEPHRMAPIVWDTPPEQRRHAPIVREPELEPAPQPEAAAPEPRKIPGGLPPIVFETVPDRPRFAPIVWDSPPEPRKLAPIVLDSDPQPSRRAPLTFGKEAETGEEKSSVPGSIFGL